MKFRILITMLLAVLLLTSLAGCSLAAAEDRLDAVGDAVEDRLDAVEDAAEAAVRQSRTPQPAASQQTAAADAVTELTREEAEAIALKHAGFTADQVTYLRTEYEIDDGRPQYEVQFHQDRWEYDYEIDAQTGKILSFDKDD